MYGRNNLSDDFEARTLTVTEPFEVHVAVGAWHTSPVPGSRRAGTVFQPVNLVPGDRLHDTYAGVLVEIDGLTYPATVDVADSPVEESRGLRFETWPVEHLSDPGPFEGLAPKAPRRLFDRSELRRSAPVGTSRHRVLPAGAVIRRRLPATA